MSQAPGGGESRATLGKWLVFQGSELREGDMASPCLDKEWAPQRGRRLWALRRGLYLQHDSGWYATLVRILLHIHYSSFSLGPSLRKREFGGPPPSSAMPQLIIWYNSEPALVMWSHPATKEPGGIVLPHVWEAETQKCTVDGTCEDHTANDRETHGEELLQSFSFNPI